MSPEAIKGQYHEKVDIWSIGVIAHVLLTGRTPFGGKSETQTFKNIKEAELDLTADHWGSVSNEAKEFVGLLLTKDLN